jgi:hypothetical protein
MIKGSRYDASFIEPPGKADVYAIVAKHHGTDIDTLFTDAFWR